MYNKKNVFTDLSSNITLKDVKTSLNFIFNPLNWFHFYSGSAVDELKRGIKKTTGAKFTYLFDSGRSSIHCCLKALGISSGDEVLVPGYTCSVVVNAVRWTGAKPVYVDIKNDFNIDSRKIKKNITNDTEAIIAHHTFGVAADINKINKIADEYGLTFIEDCAHSLGGKIKNNKIGQFGDVSIFSFGTNKVISSIRGGSAVTDKKNISKSLRSLESDLPHQPLSKIVKYIFYYPIFYIGRKFYHIKLGKWLLGLWKKLNITPKIISREEKKGERPDWIPSRLPNALAKLGVGQMKKLESFNSHRKEISKLYKQELPEHIIPDVIKKEERSVAYKFPILVDKPNNIQEKMSEKGYHLSTSWGGANIVPEGTNFDFCYNRGTCPKAEELSDKVILLPTNINTSKVEAKELSCLLKNLV